MKIGLTEGLEREEPEQKDYAFREVNREIRENLIKSIIENGNSVVPEETLVGLNAYIDEKIKVGSRPRMFKKGFTVVDAVVNGKKRVVTFASKSLAYKIMNYIKEKYEEVEITYEVTQM